MTEARSTSQFGRVDFSGVPLPAVATVLDLLAESGWTWERNAGGCQSVFRKEFALGTSSAASAAAELNDLMSAWPPLAADALAPATAESSWWDGSLSGLVEPLDTDEAGALMRSPSPPPSGKGEADIAQDEEAERGASD
jgi:hypothetical protein